MVSGGGKGKSKPGGKGQCPSCLQNREWRREAAVGEEKKSKGAVWFVFGWEEDQRTGGGSSWWNHPGEKKKIRAGGGGDPLGEDRFRSFLGFFFFVLSPPNSKIPPFCVLRE